MLYALLSRIFGKRNEKSRFLALYAQDFCDHFDDVVIEEDLNLIIHTVIPESLEDIERETLQSLTIRVFESDVEFLKRYANEHNMKYQTIMRDFIRKGTRELQL